MQIRDWLYVDDHCKAIDMVYSGGKGGEVYNVGGHNEKPNIFIVKTIIEQVGKRLNNPEINEGLIKHIEDRLGYDRRYSIAPSKIKADLGWDPEIPFEVHIVKTIDWCLENVEWIEHATSGAYQQYYAKMYKNRQQEPQTNPRGDEDIHYRRNRTACGVLLGMMCLLRQSVEVMKSQAVAEERLII